MDGLGLGGLFIGIFALFLSIRLTWYHNRIIHLQSHAKGLADDARKAFESLLNKTKKNRDPQVAFGIASQYLTWHEIEKDLAKVFRTNRLEVGYDIAGLIVSIVFALVNFAGIEWNDFTKLHFGIMLAIIVISGATFFESLIAIYRTEDKLGIGKPSPDHSNSHTAD